MGVVVRRPLALRIPRTTDMLRRVRVRFMFPVPERENFRIERHVSQKVQKEHEQWAGTYAGMPVLAVEQSDFSHGFSRESAIRALDQGSSAFCGVLATQLIHTTHDG